MAGLLADARLALRALRRSPGFSVTVVLTLGIAIGVNTAVFTVTRAVLFKGFRGIAKNDRLVYIGTQRQGRGCCASYPDIVDWRAQAQSFRDIAAVADRQIVVADVNRSAEHYDATQISPNAFRLLGRQPILGRDFVASDGDLGAPAVAILQYQFWQRRYAGDDAVLGRTIVINGVPTTIIGVMPEDFAFPQNQDLWLPLIPTAEMQRRDNRGLWFAFGRLRDGATIESARAELAAIGQRLSIAYPTTNEGWVPQPRTFAEFFVGRDAATIYGTLWAAVGFVLLIACANVSNLVLSRGLARAREWSLLTALGASRWRIVRRQLVESAMLSFAGGVGGWWIARLCVRAYEASANPPARAWSARLFDYGMDARVLVYIVAACGATTVLSGLWPSVHLSRVDGSTVIEDSGRSVAGSRRGRRLSTALVALEVATAAVLLVAAGVMVRSFANMARADLGIRPANLHAMLVNLPHDRYADQASQTRFFERLTAGLRNTDEVESIALTDRLPAEDGRRVPYELTTHPNDAEHRDTVLTVTIGPGYFDVIGAAVRAGRDFNPFDLPSAPPVAIVNQRFAEMEWPNEDPIGRRLRLFDERGSGPWLVVVGVASNVAQNVRDRQVKDAVIYRPYSQRPASGLWVVARTHPWVPHIAAAFRSAIDAIDPDVPIWVGPLSLDALMAAMGSYWLLGSNTAMFAAFAAIALFLASLGIYAVVAYSVSRRTREFGIRLAIGARRRDVLVLVLREHVRPIGVGLASGLAASLVLVPILRSQLVHVSAADPIAVLVASAVLLASALVGCLLPAHRATTIGPAIALRAE